MKIVTAEISNELYLRLKDSLLKLYPLKQDKLIQIVLNAFLAPSRLEAFEDDEEYERDEIELCKKMNFDNGSLSCLKSKHNSMNDKNSNEISKIDTLPNCAISFKLTNKLYSSLMNRTESSNEQISHIVCKALDVYLEFIVDLYAARKEVQSFLKNSEAEGYDFAKADRNKFQLIYDETYDGLSSCLNAIYSYDRSHRIFIS